jgi:hypothetical protein
MGIDPFESGCQEISAAMHVPHSVDATACRQSADACERGGRTVIFSSSREPVRFHRFIFYHTGKTVSVLKSLKSFLPFELPMDAQILAF